MAQNGRMTQLILLPGLACDERFWQAQLPALPRALAPRVSDVHMHHGRIEAMAAALLQECAAPASITICR